MRKEEEKELLLLLLLLELEEKEELQVSAVVVASLPLSLCPWNPVVGVDQSESASCQ
jgi:hypothetical protein